MHIHMKNIGICLLLALFLVACGGDSGGDSGGNKQASDGGSNQDPTPGDTGGESPTEPPPSPNFGQPNDSQIRPGVIVSAMGSQCTSNFIYKDSAGRYYIGAAAHCFSPDTNSGIDSCEARNEAIGIDVEIENAAFMGSLAYSSWQAMQDNNETPGSGICTGNDFALIRIDDRDVGNLHPAVRVFEGPTGLFKGNAQSGDGVFSYGQATPLSPTQAKSGFIDSQSPDGWIYFVTFGSPGIPGDSGSAVLHETGKGLGVLSGLTACVGICTPTSTSVVNLELALAYAKSHFNSSLKLVTWSQFNP